MTLRTFSFGAGVQSTAALVLAARGEIDYRIFLFANVGDDSEHPDTIRYFHEHHVPFAEAHDLELHELRLTWKRGERAGVQQTLYNRLLTGRTAIPIRLASGAPAKRSCTWDFKKKQISEWQEAHGATHKTPAVSGLGISMDEIHRARTDSGICSQVLEYPLLDLKLFRRDCVQIIADAGLPPVPKSACWFCPYHSKVAWVELRRTHPDLFEKTAQIEDRLNERYPGVRFLDSMVPLREGVMDGVQVLFDPDGPDGCDSGSCWT